jgi:hypothetical protein
MLSLALTNLTRRSSRNFLRLAEPALLRLRQLQQPCSHLHLHLHLNLHLWHGLPSPRHLCPKHRNRPVYRSVFLHPSFRALPMTCFLPLSLLPALSEARHFLQATPVLDSLSSTLLPPPPLSPVPDIALAAPVPCAERR